MPPKVVYGKKKTVARTTTSFAKFISADKDGIATKDSSVGDLQQKLQHAAGNKLEEDGLVALEKGLGRLRLEQPQTASVAKTNKKGRLRKAAGEREAAETKENHISQDDATGLESEVLDINDNRGPEVAPRTPTRKSRKVLGKRNVNPTTTASSQALEDRIPKDETVQYPKLSLSSSTRTSNPKSRRKPKLSAPLSQHSLPTPEPTPEPENLYSVYASPLLSLSFGRMIHPFEQWSYELEPHFDVTKIAEASFSEVYRLSALESTEHSSQESVLKLVPLKMAPNAPLPCESQTRPGKGRQSQAAKERADREETDGWKSDVTDVLSEVKLLQNLNHIPGFTNFRDLTILQGRPSPYFAKAWKAWNKSRSRGKKSEFPDPSKKTSYEDTQLWAVVEMQDAGTDCEKLMEIGGLSSIWEVWDVFWGVCLSVAKAEETCKFEHRDLHLGNICVRTSKAGGDVLDVTIEDPIRRKFRFTGLETTVIDYTLSRADILPSPSRRGSSSSISNADSTASDTDLTGVGVAFLDLDKDSGLFEGDASEEYQYEIYRYMRGATLYNNPLQNSPPESLTPQRRSPRKNTHIHFDDNESHRRSPRKSSRPDPVAQTSENVWQLFHPKTNLVWAHFLLHKLLNHLDSSANTPNQLSIRQIMSNIDGSNDELDSAKVKKKALKLHKVLKSVSELLCPVALGRQDSLGSVKELVVLALEERWLRVGDVAE